MTPVDTPGTHRHDDDDPQDTGHGGHGGHGWMMIACCIPMLMIAVALVVTGAASPGFLVIAVGCTAMMALMMGAMRSDGNDGG